MRAVINTLFLVGFGTLFFPLTQSSAEEPAKNLSLGDVVLRALTHGREIQDSCDAVQVARYGLEIAEADFGFRFTPQATSGLGTDTETSQSTTLGFSKKLSFGTNVELSGGTTWTGSDFYRSFSGVTISQSLFGGFGFLANTTGLATAERRISSARRSWRLARGDGAMEAVGSFYRIVGQKLLIAVLERSRDQTNQLLAATRAKLERGLATRMDILRAEAQAAEAESHLLDAREDLEEAKDAIRIRMGAVADEPVEVETEVIDVSLDLGEEELGRVAMEKRVDLEDAEDQVREAERSFRVAERGVYPDLRVGVNYSFTGTGESFAESTRFDDSAVRVLLSGSTSLDRRAERAQLGQARLDLEKKRREAVELRKRIAQEIRQASRHVATVKRRIAIQEKNVETAEAYLNLARLRFESGYADILEVLQAESGLTQARKAEIGLRVEQVAASLKLRQAAGLLDAFVDEVTGGRAGEGGCS